MFWNPDPEDKHIPILSLGNKFDQDLRQQTGKQGVPKTSRNGLDVVKVGHRSESCMGMMADSYDSERLRGGGEHDGIMADGHDG